MKKYLLCALISLLLFSCKENNIDNQIVSDLIAKVELLKQADTASNAYKLSNIINNELFENLNTYDLNNNEKNSLIFLYAYMPVNDMAENSFEYFVNSVKQAHKTKSLSWGKSVTPDLFYHFVLPPRVNNETLDNAREVFYDQLYDRVKGLSMYDAVIEINHWLREKVVYQPTDGRTTPPMQTVLRGYGRCGEESTVAVAALRAMGIPSRQVYVPRWAHTNSNHAWVEVWVDGTWYYLGACEPEPMLDRGWFTASASRAMLVNTFAYGKLDPKVNSQIEGEIISKNASFTEISNTSTYAPVKKAVVKVTDANNKPIVGAKVSFEIINGNNIVPLVERVTDSNGISYLKTGLGTFIIETYYKNNGKNYYAIRELRVSDTDTLYINLSSDERVGADGQTLAKDFRLTPPAETRFPKALSEQMRKVHDLKCGADDSIRHAYTSNFRFSNINDASSFSKNMVDKGMSKKNEKRLIGILSQTMNGGIEVEKFLLNTDPKNLDLAVDLLSIIRIKDVQEIKADVFSDYLNGVLILGDNYVNDPIYIQSVLNPRFSNEIPIAYKSALWQELKDNGMVSVDNKQSVVDAVTKSLDKILLINDSIINPRGFYMTPISVKDFRIADDSNYLSYARALFSTAGISTKVNNLTYQLQIYIGNRWIDYPIKTAKILKSVDKNATLIINDPIGQKTGRRYLIQKWSDDGYKRVDGFTTQTQLRGWESLATLDSKVEPGYYRIVTGIRAADGSILTRVLFFKVAPNSKKNINVEWYEAAEDDVIVIGNMDAEWKYTSDKLINTSIINTVGRNFFVLGVFEPTKEPSQHFIRELSALGGKLNLPTILMFNDASKMDFFFKQNYKLHKDINYGFDPENTILSGLEKSLLTTDLQARLPVIIVADSFGNIYYKSIGYNIGVPEAITKLNLPIK